MGISAHPLFMEETKMEMNVVQLTSINSGALTDLFGREMRKILADIDDPNKIAITKRTMVIKIEFEPAEDRETASVTIDANSKLGKNKPSQGVVVIERNDDGEVSGRVPEKRSGFELLKEEIK